MKKGFTLAEVLITLTIIGVIAVITLPSTLSKIDQKQRNTALRKTVAQFNEAYRLAAYDLGYNPRCGYWGSSGNRPYKYRAGNTETRYDANGNASWWYKDDNGNWKPYGDDANGVFSDCRAFGEAVTARLGATNICKSACYAAGVIPKYSGNDTINLVNNTNAGKYDGLDENSQEYKDKVKYDQTKATSGMGGFRQSNILNTNTMIELEDGKIIVGYMGATGYFHPRIFAIDINGRKGPNQWGEDLFYFTSEYTEDGQNVEIQIGSSYKEKNNGVSASSIFYNAPIKK